MAVTARGSSTGLRVTFAMLGGAVTCTIVSPFMPPAAAILLGWDAAAVIYLACFALLRAGWAMGSMKAWLIAVGVLSVVLSWTVVHTVFTLRYARAYYGEPAGGIEFNEKESPTYLDFGYFSSPSA